MARIKIVAVTMALMAVVFLLYGRVARNGFINFDDDTYVTANRQVLRGLTAEGVGWAFTSTVGSNYHPLTWISHMLDVELYGPSPAGHHLTNAAFHAVNAALLFLLLQVLTGALGRSALVALLFAVHPLRVESVAWVAERKDLLSGFFFLLATLAYAWYARRPGLGRYAAVFLAIVFGLLAKPMLVTAPFVLLLLDLWPLGRLGPRREWARTAPRLVLEKLPFFAVAGASSIATLWVQTRTGAARSIEVIPLGARLVNASLAYVAYLRKTVLPLDLAFFYPHPFLVDPRLSGLTVATALAATAGLVLVTVLALRQTERRPWLAVGWLWYLGTLVPVIGLVQVGEQGMADRYAYLPLVGIYLCVVWSVAEWTEVRPRLRIVAAVAGLLALAAYARATWVQVGYWKDSVRLYRHALEVTPPSPLVHNNLGLALSARGEQAEAVCQYEAALRLRPGFAPAHNNLGAVLKAQGRLPDAESQLREAIRLRPNYPEAHSNLANVLQAEGRNAEAKEEYAKALAARPDSAEAHIGLGTLLARQGDLAAARDRLETAVRLDPTRVEGRKNLGIVLMMEGKLPEAVAQYEAALALRPDDADLMSDLGALLVRLGRTTEAEARLTQALKLRPDHAGARATLAALRAAQGK